MGRGEGNLGGENLGGKEDVCGYREVGKRGERHKRDREITMNGNGRVQVDEFEGKGSGCEWLYVA